MDLNPGDFHAKLIYCELSKKKISNSIVRSKFTDLYYFRSMNHQS